MVPFIPARTPFMKQFPKNVALVFFSQSIQRFNDFFITNQALILKFIILIGNIFGEVYTYSRRSLA